VNDQAKTRDVTSPTDRWKFDQEVTDAFEDMLERSIPWYENMRAIVTEIACAFVPKGHARVGQVVDLGASRGDGLAPIVDRLGINATYHAVEISEPMLGVLRERWGDYSGMRIYDHDLRGKYPDVPPAHATLAVLTLQFVPIEHRQRILRDVWLHTAPGGVLILVEKVLGATAAIDELLVQRYYALKGKHGYSEVDIERKRLSLEGVLVPVTAAWNEELLKQAGFAEVDCFWRWANFAGWVAVR
jgi:tRNA (cmo5U34)-methyltransferase